MIFKTKDIAISAFERGIYSNDIADKAINIGGPGPSWGGNLVVRKQYYAEILNNQVSFCESAEPIFLIKEDVLQKRIGRYRFWYVIIGECIGWIIIPAWLKMEIINAAI
jgi:hypothetical protein